MEEKTSYFQLFSSMFIKIDMYPKYITLTHRGRNKFQTRLGASLSLIVFTLLALAVGEKTIKMFDRSETTIS